MSLLLTAPHRIATSVQFPTGYAWDILDQAGNPTYPINMLVFVEENIGGASGEACIILHALPLGSPCPYIQLKDGAVVRGKGGNGGDAKAGYANGNPGGAGGDCISCDNDAYIEVDSGCSLLAGGGGGGGGATTYGYLSGAGGGGRGSPGGDGGSPDGGVGSEAAPGLGSEPYHPSCGWGGDGGDTALVGADGGGATGGYSGGAGGAPGKAVRDLGSHNITVVNNGTIEGDYPGA